MYRCRNVDQYRYQNFDGFITNTKLLNDTDPKFWPIHQNDTYLIWPIPSQKFDRYMKQYRYQTFDRYRYRILTSIPKLLILKFWPLSIQNIDRYTKITDIKLLTNTPEILIPNFLTISDINLLTDTSTTKLDQIPALHIPNIWPIPIPKFWPIHQNKIPNFLPILILKILTNTNTTKLQYVYRFKYL